MALMNTDLDAIMREYSLRQAAARHELEERIDRIHREIPALERVEQELLTLRTAQARAAIEGNIQKKTELQKKSAELLETKKELLAAGGYTAEDLEIRYICPDCRDTGYVDGHRCHCLKQEIIRHLYSQSHLDKILATENFDTFSYNWYDECDLPVIRRIVDGVHDFTEHFDTDFSNILLLGQPGTGKTFLANCIAKELIDRCYSVVYLTAFELFDLMAEAAFRNKKAEGSFRQSYEYVFDCDLLIIDDLGTELTNSFVASQLFLCVNERILKKKATVISSNLSLEALRDAYSERTLSRITSAYRIYKMPGSDIRLKKRLAGNVGRS